MRLHASQRAVHGAPLRLDLRGIYDRGKQATIHTNTFSAIILTNSPQDTGALKWNWQPRSQLPAMLHIVDMDWGQMKYEMMPTKRTFSHGMIADRLWGVINDEIRAATRAPTMLNARTLRVVLKLAVCQSTESGLRLNSQLLESARQLLLRTAEAEEAADVDDETEQMPIDMDPEAETRPDIDGEGDTGTDIDADTEIDADTDIDPDSDVGTTIDTDTEIDAGTEIDSDTDTKIGTDAEAE